MPLITETETDSVRRLIDSTLTATALPDAVLLDDVLVGATDRAIVARYPGALTETDPEKQEAIRAAAVFWHAGTVGPSTPSLVSERMTDYQYQRQPVDYAARAAWLRAQAEAILDDLTPAPDEPDATAIPVLFVAAPGYRGRL